MSGIIILALSLIVQAMAQEAKPQQGTDDRAQALKKYLEAQSLEKSGNYPGAVEAYKEAIKLDPSSAELRVAFASLYLNNRNLIDAEAQAREAIKIAPGNIDVRKLVARVYLAQSFVGTSLDKDKARQALKELEEVGKLNASAKIPIGDQDVPVFSIIGELYDSLGEEDKALDALKRVAETDTSADNAQFRLAMLYYQKNKLREAEGAARKAYDIKPDAPQYAGLLAKTLLRLGRTQEALDIYKKALGIKDASATVKKDDKDNKADPNDKDDDDDESSGTIKAGLITSPLLGDYAEALVFAGHYDEATKLLEPVLKIVKKDTPFYLNAIRIVADAQRRSGKREDAVQTLQEALKGQDVSESLPVLYSLAETYEEMHKFDKAVDTYEEALSTIVNPDGTVSDNQQDKQNAALMLQRIGLAYRLAGNRDKEMATFGRMKKVLGPDNPRADQLIIDSLLNEGKNKEALEHASESAKRFPDESSFNQYKAQAAVRLGDTKTSDEILKSQLKGGREDADIYLFWSSMQLEANQLKQAEEYVRKAMEIEPNDIRPLITLSIVQDRQKKFKESEATLKKALEIDPENATVLNNLGYFLTERGERMKEAEDFIRRAVNIEPTNGSYLDSLGWLLFKEGKTDEAEKYLEQAIIYSPRSPTINDHLGDLYKKQGKMDKARAQWEEALKLATEPEEIQQIKEKLNKK